MKEKRFFKGQHGLEFVSRSKKGATEEILKKQAWDKILEVEKNMVKSTAVALERRQQRRKRG